VQVYGGFNVLQRRKAKENNFKAVLESIRDLMHEEAAIPAWMHDLFLGYGDPADTQYTVRATGSSALLRWHFCTCCTSCSSVHRVNRGVHYTAHICCS
jgi:Intron-binding protein aquarius N-terminus